MLLSQVALRADAAAPNVTASVALGQDDLTHGNFNLTDAGSLSLSGSLNSSVVTDSQGHVYVSDETNNRVLGWRSATSLVNGQAADLVLGQPDFLSYSCPSPTASTLCGPEGIAVDSSGNLYVADETNNRVLEYKTPFSACASFPCVGPAASLVFGQGSSGSNFTANVCANGSSPNPSPSATGLCSPHGVAVDSSGNLYIADGANSRVLEYNHPLSSPPNVTANLVIGQGSTGTNFTANSCADGAGTDPAVSATGLCFPYGVAMDGANDLYVADNFNNRVLEYNTPLGNPTNVTANLVFGQGSSGTNFTANTCANGSSPNPAPSATGICSPQGVALDSSGNLYVGDTGNNRVLKFNDPLGSSPPNVTANLVFGQGSSGTDFTANACADGVDSDPAISATGICRPAGVAASSSGQVYIADQGNNRLLGYGSANATANLVLGQYDFAHNVKNRTKANGLGENGAGVDSRVAADSSGHVYVADNGNNRVLGWRNAGSLVSGQAADLVIGQADFISYLANRGNSTPAANTLNLPVGVATDSAGNLYVADYYNSRVLEFNAPFAACASFPCVGGNANLVFGIDASGKNFTTAGTCGTPSATNLCNPSAIAVDSSGNVYISDNGHGRVLEYNNALASTNVTANTVFGVDASGTNFTSGGCGGTSATSLCSPAGVALDGRNNLYVADNGESRVVEYNSPLSSNPPNVTANLVFGQGSSGTNFTANTCANGSFSNPAPSATGLCGPSGIALDGSGNLYVADNLNNRVLEYVNPLGSNPPNVTASTVFGQGSSGTNFTANACANGSGSPAPISATGLCTPAGVALDYLGNIYVVDLTNNRAVVYSQSAPTPTPTATASSTPTPTATASSTPTQTPTPTASASPTATLSPTPTATSSQTPAPTQAPTATLVPPTATATLAPTSGPTAVPTQTAAPTPTAAPTAAANVALTGTGNGSGGPGATVSGGSFSLTNTTSGVETIASVSIVVSDPKLFGSLTLTASVGGQQTAVTVSGSAIAATTLFEFSPALIVPAGGSVTFSLSTVISLNPAMNDQMGVRYAYASIVPMSSDGQSRGMVPLLLGLGLIGMVMMLSEKRKRRHTALAVAVALALMAAIAGCSSSSSSSKPSSTQVVQGAAVSQGGTPQKVAGLPLLLGTIQQQ
ncbi:MAG TPA: NHL repeat-containing protein [Candidatus Binataceae bacterium]|nr:NHL repeat-containing protein [Candidatus Binataceae bacterium]